MKARFLLKTSKHFQDGKEYKKGDIVESHYSLDKLFANKFERVADQPVAPASAPTPAPSEPAASPAAAPASPEGEQTGANAGSGEDEAAKGKASAEPLGEDATEDFPEAVKAELKVFQKGKQFFVAQPETPTVALNAKALTAKEVAGFIKKTLGSK